MYRVPKERTNLQLSEIKVICAWGLYVIKNIVIRNAWYPVFYAGIAELEGHPAAGEAAGRVRPQVARL